MFWTQGWIFPPHKRSYCLGSMLMRIFETLYLDYISSHFALQACSHTFFVSSLPACGRLSVALHRIVDNMTCYSRRWVFRIASTYKFPPRIYLWELQLERPKNWPWVWGYLNPKQRSQQMMQHQKKRANVWRQRPLGRVKNQQLR